MPDPVELLTACDHFSLGDIAIHEATLVGLAERGVSVVPVAEPSERRTCIVGGGHLIGLPRFHVHGRHATNAVGLRRRTGDVTHLAKYRYVSVRDERSTWRLAISGIPATAVPCPSVLLDPRPVTQAVEGRVVLHNDPAVFRSVHGKEFDRPSLVVDPQPWRGHRWRGPEPVAPLTHSPAVMAGWLQGAAVVVTRSLHLSIFALVAGVPFTCLVRGGRHDAQGCKMRDYWKRAGIPEVAYNGPDPVGHALSSSVAWGDVLDRERTLAADHLDRLAEAVS